MADIESRLQKLISFKTTTGDLEACRSAFAWVLKDIQNLPLHTHTFHIKGFDSLLLTTRKTKKPRLWLAAHMDVVPGSAGIFTSRHTRDRIYGRGAYDMKFAISCFLTLVQDLGKELPKYDFGIMLTSDEEVGGQHGVKELLKKGFTSKAAFIPDGGHDWHNERMAKGIWHLKVQSRGVAAHGSRPWDGENAIDSLVHFLYTLNSLFIQEPCGDKRHLHPTINVGKITGGNAVNQIADYAEVDLDIRFVREKEYVRMRKSIERMRTRFPNMMCKDVVLSKDFNSDQTSPYHILFASSAKEMHAIERPTVISHGASDARYFGELNIPTIVTRPKGSDCPSEREWIDLRDLKRFYNVTKEFVQKASRI